MKVLNILLGTNLASFCVRVCLEGCVCNTQRQNCEGRQHLLVLRWRCGRWIGERLSEAALHVPLQAGSSATIRNGSPGPVRYSSCMCRMELLLTAARSLPQLPFRTATPRKSVLDHTIGVRDEVDTRSECCPIRRRGRRSSHPPRSDCTHTWAELGQRTGAHGRLASSASSASASA
jgi:hypothetical protein